MNFGAPDHDACDPDARRELASDASAGAGDRPADDVTRYFHSFHSSPGHEGRSLWLTMSITRRSAGGPYPCLTVSLLGGATLRV